MSDKKLYSIKWTQPYLNWPKPNSTDCEFLENLIFELEELAVQDSDMGQARRVIDKIKQNIK